MFDVNRQTFKWLTPLFVALLVVGVVPTLVSAQSEVFHVPILDLFKSVFTPPQEFTATMVVSIRGGDAGELGLELTGKLEVLDSASYRFTYEAPPTIAGRVVAVSGNVGYTYGSDPENGDFIYYPSGVGFLMPLQRMMDLMQRLSTLQVVDVGVGEWAGRTMQIVTVRSGLDEPDQAAIWEGKVWIDPTACFPARYELISDAGKEIYEIGMVHWRDKENLQLEQFTLSGVSQSEGDQFSATFTYGEGGWLPTSVRFSSGLEVIEQIVTDLDFSSVDPDKVRVPKLEAMRYHLEEADKAQSEGNNAAFAAHMEEVARLDPYNYVAHLDLGYVYLMLEDDIQAEAHLQQALMLKPDLAVAYNNLAYLYVERGLYLNKAASLAEKAVQLEGDNPAYLDTLGWVYYHQGKLLEAVRYLKRALEAGQGDMAPESLVEIYYHLALAYRSTGASALFEDTVEKGLALQVDSPFTEKLRGLLQSQE